MNVDPSPLRFLVLPKAVLSAVCMLLTLAGGCGGVKAPTTPNGNPVEVLFIFNANIDEKASEELQEEHQRLARWIEKDIIRRLNEGGYQVTSGTDVKEFEPGKGRFLITVKIVEYVPASATSREEAGFGAGTTIIDTYSELFKDNHTIPRFRLKKGSVSARDWLVPAEEVTSNVAKELSQTMNEMY